MPKLLLKFNAAVIKEVAVDKDEIRVGRKPDNDVVIDNPAISGHHCRIAKRGDAYFIEDLDSTNGTYLNEKRVKTADLKSNDVIGIAKHALVFVTEAAAPPGPPPPPSDATVMIGAGNQAEIIVASTAAASGGDKQKSGWLRVLKGVVGEPEYELKGNSTYIGKSDRVHIPIKGTGLFGSAPEVAASIHRKPEGFVLVAVTDGYPIVNGTKISGSIVLKEGDIIDCGATTMQFDTREPAA
ncbi:MAG: FHA domain-containing protein [Elusimicrobia bacterium]|nr:FHA domain-containing protein [Elusimicrobiota bacterium]